MLIASVLYKELKGPITVRCSYVPADAVLPYTLKTCETLLESLGEKDAKVYYVLSLEAVSRCNIP